MTAGSLAGIAERLADDPAVAAAVKRLAVGVLHRLRCGGRITSRDAWRLRAIAERQRAIARRWTR